MSGLATRVATALILAGGFLTVLWVPQLEFAFYAFVTIMATIGLVEYFGLLKDKGFSKTPWIAIALGTAVVFNGNQGSDVIVNATATFATIFLVFVLIVRSDATIQTLLGTAIGIVYVAWTAAHVNLLYTMGVIGPGLVTSLAVAVALTDVGAYFVGKSIGAHKLAPVVSPNKTWEGAIGGFVVAGIGMAVLWQLKQSFDWASYPEWPIGKYIVIGAILSIASQVGDLTQSALKRDAGVKDSGNIFPGHGGVLDRCDGFLFAAPVLYYLLHF